MIEQLNQVLSWSVPTNYDADCRLQVAKLKTFFLRSIELLLLSSLLLLLLLLFVYTNKNSDKYKWIITR